MTGSAVRDHRRPVISANPIVRRRTKNSSCRLRKRVSRRTSQPRWGSLRGCSTLRGNCRIPSISFDWNWIIGPILMTLISRGRRTNSLLTAYRKNSKKLWPIERGLQLKTVRWRGKCSGNSSKLSSLWKIILLFKIGRIKEVSNKLKDVAKNLIRR